VLRTIDVIDDSVHETDAFEKHDRDKIQTMRSASSFRDGPKDQTRNLEIPGSSLRDAPE
jgi:hypothetical protein